MAFAIKNPPPFWGVPNGPAIQLADQSAASSEQALLRAATRFAVALYLKTNDATAHTFSIQAQDVGAGNAVVIGFITVPASFTGMVCLDAVNPTGAQKAMSIQLTGAGTFAYDAWIIPLG